VKVLVNPTGTNERFDRASLDQAVIISTSDNLKIFEVLAAGRGDVMITDAVETKLQQKLHPELCAIHPDQPFDFGELGYFLPRDIVLRQFVDRWLHIVVESGTRSRLVERYLGP
jgi:cyclohexadienyl dehydratase